MVWPLHHKIHFKAVCLKRFPLQCIPLPVAVHKTVRVVYGITLYRPTGKSNSNWKVIPKPNVYWATNISFCQSTEHFHCCKQHLQRGRGGLRWWTLSTGCNPGFEPRDVAMATIPGKAFHSAIWLGGGRGQDFCLRPFCGRGSHRRRPSGTSSWAACWPVLAFDF